MLLHAIVFSFICVTFRSARCTRQCFVVIFSCSFGITGCVPLLGLLNSFARPYLVLLASTVNGYEGRLHRRGWRVDSKTKRMRSWFETTTVQGCWVTIQARQLQPHSCSQWSCFFWNEFQAAAEYETRIERGSAIENLMIKKHQRNRQMMNESHFCESLNFK